MLVLLQFTENLFPFQGCLSLGIYHPHHQYDWLFEPPQKIRAEVKVNGTFQVQEIALWHHNPSWRGEIFLTLGEFLIFKSRYFFGKAHSEVFVCEMIQDICCAITASSSYTMAPNKLDVLSRGSLICSGFFRHITRLKKTLSTILKLPRLLSRGSVQWTPAVRNLKR